MSTTRNILSVILLAGIAVLFWCCAGLQSTPTPAGKNYVYSYVLTEPAQNVDLKFRDTYIDIQFAFDASTLSFRMQNNSDQQLSIEWEKVSIAVNRRAYSVRNLTTFYAAGDASPQPLVVPPKGFLYETLIPWQNIYRDKEGWRENELFPTNDSGSVQRQTEIEGKKGSEVMLLLPVRIGRLVMEYAFTFSVAGATPLSPGEPIHRNERPPKPSAMPAESSMMQGYLPIMISAGILVAAIYFFSQKKEPAEGL